MTLTRKSQLGFGVVQIIWVLAGLVVASAAAWHVVRDSRDPHAAVAFATPFQAVLLANGSVYFGKLEGYGTVAPVLRQVYYIVAQTNPETKQSANVLVKRDKEMHEPDRMYLNPEQIVFVEPVSPSSKVAQLIAESAPK
jgi:uncharacterized membrane protein (DUF485 family)